MTFEKQTPSSVEPLPKESREEFIANCFEKHPKLLAACQSNIARINAASH